MTARGYICLATSHLLTLLNGFLSNLGSLFVSPLSTTAANTCTSSSPTMSALRTGLFAQSDQAESPGLHGADAVSSLDKIWQIYDFMDARRPF